MSDQEKSSEELKNDEEEATEEEEKEYEVEAILKHRQKGRKKEYLIKWVGYDDKDNTWEPEDHLAHLPEMLKSYWENYNSKKEKEKEEKREKQKQKEKEKKEAKKETKTAKKEKTSKNQEIKRDEDLLLSNDPIEIVGAMKISEGNIVFAVKQNGKNILIPNKELRNKHPRELLDFYEKHLEIVDTDDILFTL